MSSIDEHRWGRMKEVFSAVIACGPDRAPAALLSECEGDDELLRELGPMVEEHFRLLSAAQAAAGRGAPPELSSVVAGRFRVLARLGGGSFGDVYRVIDEASGGEQLALKILRSCDPVALHYFKREFRSLSGIYHPNIVALHDLIAHGDRWMFSMEFIDGVDLLRYAESQPTYERYDAVYSCVRQLAEGVHALHQRNLLHRDLKPSNVLVTATGRLVLLDFGLVRAFGEETQDAATFAGTPHYMSPEQAAGGTLGEPTDWYALGVMLYQILTGRLPFECSPVEVLQRKRWERPIAPLEITGSVPCEAERPVPEATRSGP